MARHAPIAVSEVLERYPAQIVQSLLDRRLLVQVGEKPFLILRALEKERFFYKKQLLHQHDEIQLKHGRCALSLSENYRSLFEIE